MNRARPFRAGERLQAGELVVLCFDCNQGWAFTPDIDKAMADEFRLKYPEAVGSKKPEHRVVYICPACVLARLVDEGMPEET